MTPEISALIPQAPNIPGPPELMATLLFLTRPIWIACGNLNCPILFFTVGCRTYPLRLTK